MKKKIVVTLSVILVVVLALLGVVLGRTLGFTSSQLNVAPVAQVPLDESALAERLGKALQYKTIFSQDPDQFDRQAFLGLHGYLRAAFPLVHSRLKVETVEDYSLLFTWQGTDAAIKPALFLAHLDVVPVQRSAENGWQHPPFSGVVAEGYVWGRGALDDKGSMLALLESVEYLLTQGFEPTRTILLAFGHDEESGGSRGAVKIAALLASRGVEPEFVLDEGMALTEGIMPGVTGPVAFIGVAEKGKLTVELVVEGSGGHSSQPPAETTVGILAKAVHRLEAHPMPAKLEGPLRTCFERLGPEMSFPMRGVLANMDLLAPVLKQQLAQSRATNASMRTTTAPTIFEAGVKSNVLPSRARAVVNFRILPGDTVNSVLDHVESTIDDPRVTVRTIGKKSEPSPVSPMDSASYVWLETAIRQVFPDALVAPGLVLGATDSRHYTGLTPNVYRFMPLLLRNEDLKRIHGANERVGVQDYAQAVRFFIQLMRNINEM